MQRNIRALKNFIAAGADWTTCTKASIVPTKSTTQALPWCYLLLANTSKRNTFGRPNSKQCDAMFCTLFLLCNFSGLRFSGDMNRSLAKRN